MAGADKIPYNPTIPYMAGADKGTMSIFPKCPLYCVAV